MVEVVIALGALGIIGAGFMAALQGSTKALITADTNGPRPRVWRAQSWK